MTRGGCCPRLRMKTLNTVWSLACVSALFSAGAVSAAEKDCGACCEPAAVAEPAARGGKSSLAHARAKAAKAEADQAAELRAAARAEKRALKAKKGEISPAVAPLPAAPAEHAAAGGGKSSRAHAQAKAAKEAADRAAQSTE